jgi:hypothetical protein
MTAIEEKKRQRFQFMEVVYNNTQGDPFQMTGLNAVAPAIGLSEEEAGKVGEYLSDEDLIKWTLGGGISITHRGVVEYEQALSAPATPTEHFPAVNYIHIGTMTNSQFQQGTMGSVQQMQTVSSDEAGVLREFLAIIREQAKALRFAAEEEAELESQLATIEAQMHSAKPNRSILKAAGSAVLAILVSAPGQEAVKAILKHVPDWIK